MHEPALGLVAVETSAAGGAGGAGEAGAGVVVGAFVAAVEHHSRRNRLIISLIMGRECTGRSCRRSSSIRACDS